MADLTTSYMGLELRNPLVVSSCDFTRNAAGIQRCEEAGAGAVVLKSIFEEQFLLKEDLLEKDYNIYPEAVDYLRSGGLLDYAPQKICQTIEEAKKKIKIPIIASINCQTLKLWPRFAKQLAEAGADGLELNIYYLPLELDTPGTQYEELHLQILREIKAVVTVPVSIKLPFQLSSIPYVANRLAESGCDALVLFNWFMEPDIDVQKMRSKNTVGKGNFNQSLRWVALLAGRIKCELASSGGMMSGADMVKQILAGASAVQACSLFYQKGLETIHDLLIELDTWMEEHHLASVEDFRGELSFKKQDLNVRGIGEAEAYLRAQYMKTYKKFE
jgi:dihydroorotate dehydrogenase (fumarate)